MHAMSQKMDHQLTVIILTKI